MPRGHGNFRNVLLGTTFAMGVLVAASYMLGAPLWLAVGGVIFSVASLATVMLAQRPNFPSAAIDFRRIVGVFFVVPLLVGVSVIVSLTLGLSSGAALALGGVTFLGGNYVFFRWFDVLRYRREGGSG